MQLNKALKTIFKKAGQEEKLPPLPPSAMFKKKSSSFLDKRLAGLQNYFLKVLSASEPDVPTVQEVRDFCQLDAPLKKG